MPPAEGMLNNFLRSVGQFRDLIIALLIVGIVVIIIIPISPVLLDILLVFSLSFALLVFLTTMFTEKPLDFSVFPSLLLVATLLRLSLNISSTRLILTQANAGSVIKAFGDFVVGGNIVVGIIVFLIITVIQFVVITNGAGRVAEVAARFTLDAMPGKQMSIDADLNAGLITEDEAREKRKELQREADFFGAMDGASKFVRGDAIAGIVIILVNIIGGLLIGMLMMGMEPMEAVERYTKLTVGDGLVTQLPALLISTATGILVTRSQGEENLGEGLIRQLSAFPRLLGLVSLILLVLGLAPGMPTLPFLALAVLIGYAAYSLSKTKRAKLEEEAKEVTAKRQPENVLNLLEVDPLELEIGYNLIPLADETQGGDLLDRLAALRRQITSEMGMYVRPIRVRDNLQLKPYEYVIKIRGIESERGEIYPGQYLALNPLGLEEEVNGLATTEPTFNLPAWWVDEKEKERIEVLGFSVVDAATVLVTHMGEFIKRHAAELLGRQEVKEMIDKIKETNPAVVEELIPEILSIGEIQKVLQNLLREEIPIKDLVTILETLADNARLTKDLNYLTEACRQALSRTITHKYAPEGELDVLLLDPAVEELVENSLKTTTQGTFPVLEPKTLQHFLDKLKEAAEKAHFRRQPIIITSPKIRLPLRRLLERYMPEIAVLAINELVSTTRINALGKVSLE